MSPRHLIWGRGEGMPAWKGSVFLPPDGMGLWEQGLADGVSWRPLLSTQPSVSYLHHTGVCEAASWHSAL